MPYPIFRKYIAKRSNGLYVELVATNYNRNIENVMRFVKALKEEFPFLLDKNIRIEDGDPARDKHKLVVSTFIRNKYL
jgi:hypothetical protein